MSKSTKIIMDRLGGGHHVSSSQTKPDIVTPSESELAKDPDDDRLEHVLMAFKSFDPKKNKIPQ